MDDPTSWHDPNGPAEKAFQTFTANRRISHGPDDGKVMSYSLAEIAYLLDMYNKSPTGLVSYSEHVQLFRSILDRVRHRVFAALCSWERQLTYSNVNEKIFERFRARVDTIFAHGAPQLLDQFSAIYRRLREASKDPTAPVTEDLAQAVTTCRRILKAVADHTLPGVPGTKTATGQSLGDEAYRNRIYQFVKDNIPSETVAGPVTASFGGIIDRFNAVDKLASKGVHAELGLHEAELCAINTYLIAGELLTIHTTIPPRHLTPTNLTDNAVRQCRPPAARRSLAVALRTRFCLSRSGSL